MALRKITIALFLGLTALVAGDFRYGHFRGFGPDDARSSWLSDGYSVYRSEATQLSPRYAGSPSYPQDNLKHGTNPIASVVGPGIKKVPKEDKGSKKVLSPFYGLADADDPKIKEVVLKSGAPYCQEIKAKSGVADLTASGQKLVTCYRCKDPKNGASYEHCSYSSQLPRSSTRGPRSNSAAEKILDSLSSAATHYRHSGEPKGADNLPKAFRFSDDYFQPEASHDLPTEYEKNIDHCERVVKDSMVCMICKDPKTSGKYEQCSYVAQPNEKAYAYTKSSSFGPTKGSKPRERTSKQQANKKAKRPTKPRDDETEKDDVGAEDRDGEGEEEKEEASESRGDRYGHREREELTERPESEHSHDESDSSDDKEGHGSHYVPDHVYHYPSYKDYRPSFDSYDAEEEAEDSGSRRNVNKAKGNCKTLDKDGQSCTVCTDPKTGAKSEKCNYSHEPKDKVYKYSKSKSFGYPESRKDDGEEAEAESDRTAESSDKKERESSAEEYGSYSRTEPSTLDFIRSESEKISKKVKGKGECKKVKKDSMLCTVCKDPKTGGDYEQCNYSYDPDDKVFAYSKSTSFGSPTKISAEDEYGDSAEEHPEETYSLPIIYPTGTSPLDYIPKSGAGYSTRSYTTEEPQVQNDEEESESKDKASKVDSGFYDATVRRAEIEKIVKKMGEEDRSKCKKTLREGMTCYRCTNSKGFTNEECVYVTEPVVEASKEKSVQVKNGTPNSSQPDSVTSPTARTTTTTTTTTMTKPTTTTTKTTTTKTTTTRTTVAASASKLLEPLTSNSWMSMVTKRKIREAKEKAKDPDEELEILEDERHEAEPYDFVAETRPVYDKILGISLPAYMLQKSPHEIEFDEAVENSRF